MIAPILNERYQIGEKIGQGGMGQVYQAHDTLLDRDVAIKVLNNTGMGTEAKDRLLREAQAAARLNHPNIIAVYDAGVYQPGPTETGKDGESFPFIVMELAVGKSLHVRPPE